MKSVFAFGCSVLLAAAFSSPAAGQFFNQGAPAASQVGALGGSFASRAMTRPLGGIRPPVVAAPGFPGPARGGRPGFRGPGPGTGIPYAYSVYVPSYFDSYADPYAYPQSVAPSVAQQSAPAPPVIINQYFSGPPPDQNAPVSQNYQSNPAPQQAPDTGAASTPGAPLAPPENYYLIAYKNHSVYAALAYWVEDGTLHYVTTQNTHNQASMDLIDIELTKNLNQARNVTFSLPGQ
jgi:hypothetical protein